MKILISENTYKKILLEVSIQQLFNVFVNTGKIDKDTFNDIVDASNNKTMYATWLSKKVVDNIIKPEDVYKYKKYFNIFERRKKEYPFTDINTYRSLKDVQHFISTSIKLLDMEYSDPSQQKGIEKSDKYREFYIGEVDGFKVYKLPKGRNDLYGASCELGSNTEWCTATGKNRGYFDQYIMKDDLYIFTKKDEKYQFHYQSDQFMDKDDNPIL